MNVEWAPGAELAGSIFASVESQRPLDARVAAEFGAHTRAQGLTLMFSSA